MSKSVQMNLRVLPETKARVKDMAQKTYRDNGDLIDWLVSEAHEKMFPKDQTKQIDQPNTVTE